MNYVYAPLLQTGINSIYKQTINQYKSMQIELDYLQCLLLEERQGRLCQVHE